jgi:hypothetical protein
MLFQMFFTIGRYEKLKTKQIYKMLTAFKELVSDKESRDFLDEVSTKVAYIGVASSSHDDSFRADGFHWIDRGRMKNSNLLVTYYSIAVPPDPSSSNRKLAHSNEFTKKVYVKSDEPFDTGSPFLVWYNGDVSKGVLFPHGNSKKDKLYLPTTFQTKKRLKAAASQTESTTLIYQQSSMPTSLKHCKLILLSFSQKILKKIQFWIIDI